MSNTRISFIPTVPGLVTPPGYSYAAVAPPGRLVYVAGQVGLDEHGVLVGKDDFAAQVQQAFANLQRILAAAGCMAADVLKMTYFVVGLTPERLASVRSARNDFFPGDKPASTLLGVQALFSPDCLFEVEAVAVLPG